MLFLSNVVLEVIHIIHNCRDRDDGVIKYLGVWCNPGDLNGMYNIALEPCTALYDDPIKAGDTCSYIKAKGNIEFTLKFTIRKEGC